MNRIICLLLFLALSVKETSGQVAVIANNTVPIDKITGLQLLDFYTGDVKYWKDGKPVIVFDLKTKDQIKDKFYNFIGKSSSRMKSIWMKRMLSGEGDPPESLDTEEAMLSRIIITPGAIGFISRSKVTEKVKVLAIIN